MSETRVFRFPRQRTARLAWTTLGITALVFLYAFFDASRGGWANALGWAVSVSAIANLSVWLAWRWRSRFALEVNDRGLRLHSGKQISWDSIRALRVRDMHLEYLDLHSRRLAKASVQLDGFDELLEISLQRLPQPVAKSFARSALVRLALTSAIAAFPLLAIGVWWTRGDALALLPILFLGLLGIDAAAGVWRVRIEPDGVRVQSALREWVVPLGPASVVRIGASGSTAETLVDGEGVSPGDRAVLPLYVALRAAIAQRAGK